MRIMSGSLAVAVLLFTGCAHHGRLLRNGDVPPILEEQSDSKFIRVIGIGVAPARTRGDTLQKALARSAALSAARWELAILLRGVRISGDLTVERAMHKDGHIREEMNQLIAGAVERRVEFTRDNGAIVLLEIERAEVQKVLDDLGSRESSDVSLGSLEQQIKLSAVRLKQIKARMPGMSVAEAEQ